jgi:hypothetical protein
MKRPIPSQAVSSQKLSFPTIYSQLAHHWQQAEDSTQAIYYLEKAGEQARQKGDFERAMQLYNEALRLEAETAM